MQATPSSPGSSRADVLLVATLSGALPGVVPMGAIDLMNRLQVQKLGLYAREVKTEHVRRARVIAIPVHWFYSMAPALRIAEAYKRVNPDVAIVTGGYTATLFDEELVGTGHFDYVVRGDGEEVFPDLIERLVDGGSVESLAAITTRDFRSDDRCPAATRSYDCGNYRDIGWFPSFERLAMRLQRARDVSYLFPWVPVAKGCLYDCRDCFANEASQRTLCGRGVLERSARAVRADLHYWSQRRDIRHCHFNVDFIGMSGPDRAAEILDGSRHKLRCYYEWYRPPTRDDAERLHESFEGVVHGLFFNQSDDCVNHGGADVVEQEESVRRRLATLLPSRRHGVILYVDPALARADGRYARAAARLAGHEGVEVRRYDGNLFQGLDDLDADERERFRTDLLARARREVPRYRLQHGVTAGLARWAPRLLPALYGAGSLQYRRELSRCASAGGR